MIGGFFGPGLRATSGILTQGFPHAFGQPATTMLASLVTVTLLTLCLSVGGGLRLSRGLWYNSWRGRNAGNVHA